MTTPILLTLEVQNGHEQPRQMELLTHELAEMSAKLEETTNWTEEDQFIVHAFEGEHHGVDSERARTFFAETVAELSLEFPDLIFVLNVYEDTEEPRSIMRREYFWDGGRQIALPVVVVPDIDLEGSFEVIAEVDE